jgi:hypothetical protein
LRVKSVVFDLRSTNLLSSTSQLALELAGIGSLISPWYGYLNFTKTMM